MSPLIIFLVVLGVAAVVALVAYVLYRVLLCTSCARLFGGKTFEDPFFTNGWMKYVWPQNNKPILHYAK